MTILLTIIHIVVCLFLILVVLAQQGKGQDLASAFGGGGGAAAFGARGTATLLSNITTDGAIVFMLTSLGLTYLKPALTGETVVPNAPAPEIQQEEPGTEGAQPTTEGEAPTGVEEASPEAGDEGQPGEEPAEAEAEPESKGEAPQPKKKQ
jgi:preprotein translocase subunit SecG